MDKITEQDLANRGVKGLPDVPGLTTEEMQRKLEEIAREILIPKVNELVEGLNNANSNLQATKDSFAYKYANMKVTKNGTYSIRCNSGYASFIVIGFMQNVGMYQLLITCQGGEINVSPIISTAQNNASKEKITVSYSYGGLYLTFSEKSNFIMLGTDSEL